MADQTVAPEHEPSPKQKSSNLGGCLIVGLAGTLVILGLAIFLPSHLSSVDPDRRSQYSAQSQIDQVTRGQQVFYLEHNTFTNSCNDLWFDDDRFDADSVEGYSIQITHADAKFSVVKAIPNREGLRAYVGAVTLKDGFPISSLCESKNFGQSISDPVVIKGVLTCGSGSVKRW